MTWGGIIAAGAGLFGGMMTNAANEDLQNDAQRFNSAEAAKHRTWLHDEAYAGRKWEAGEAIKTRRFNAGEALKNRNFQEMQRETQYRTAVGDLKKAGLNPMLSLMQGGAHPTSGSAASSSIPHASTASGSSPAKAVVIPKVDYVGHALSTGFQVEKLAHETENVKTQNDLLKAQQQETLAHARLLEADRTKSLTSAEQMRQEMHESAQRIGKMRFEIEELQARTEEQRARMGVHTSDMELKWAEKLLKDAEREQTKGKTGLIPLQEKLMQIEAILSGQQIPKSTNEAAIQSSWWSRKVAPYLPDFLKSTSGAAAAKRVFQ